MAGVQGSALAVAVCNAGGLGSLPAALLDVDELPRRAGGDPRADDEAVQRELLLPRRSRAADARRARRRGGRRSRPTSPSSASTRTRSRRARRASPFNLEAANALADFKPAVVSFHFGLPAEDLLARVRAWGAKVLSSATTVDEARWLEARGVDAIIAQGVEAGGHRAMFLSDAVATQVGTLALVPQIADAVKVPVIAAGGIADARGVAAAMALGASGVQVGTAYLLCPETTTSPVHRAALKTDAARVTALTNVFTGRPARAIVNRAGAGAGPDQRAAPAFPGAATAIAPLRARAESQGSGDFSPLWAGQNASACREIAGRRRHARAGERRADLTIRAARLSSRRARRGGRRAGRAGCSGTRRGTPGPARAPCACSPPRSIASMRMASASGSSIPWGWRAR